MRKQHGFSLVELMVAMVVFMFAMAAASTIFIPLVSQFKQQSKIAETNIAGLVGLELMRTDLGQAGYGLPWYFPSDTIAYTETAAAPASSTINTAVVNDAPGNPPRAVAAFNSVSFSGPVNGNANITGIAAGSDYLVIKSASVSGTDMAQKWSFIVAENEPNPRTWAVASENLSPTDKVIVIKPKVGDVRLRELVMNGAAFYTSYSPFPSSFSPSSLSSDPYETYLIYGIDSGATLNMPFNRADYFVGIPAAAVRPTRCAIGTGVLYKAVLSQAGTFIPSNTTPLLDCVADMQVIFGLDMNGNGTIGTYSNADGSVAVDATNITGEGEGLTASVPDVLKSHSDLADYRSSAVEVRIYVLAHEGQRDPGFTYPAAKNPILVGSLDNVSAPLGRAFDLSTLGDPNWQTYRWKVYTMVVKLQNMR